MTVGFRSCTQIDSTSITVPMRTPSVALVHVCGSVREGAPTTTPRLHKTTTPGTTIVRWSELLPDSGRCIAKYIVEEGPNPAGGSPDCCNNEGSQDGFRPLNDPDPTGFGGGTIFNGYIHAGAGERNQKHNTLLLYPSNNISVALMCTSPICMCCLTLNCSIV